MGRTTRPLAELSDRLTIKQALRPLRGKAFRTPGGWWDLPRAPRVDHLFVDGERVAVEWRDRGGISDRPYFRCPACDRRCSNLWRPPGAAAWRCVKCAGVIFASQRYPKCFGARCESLRRELLRLAALVRETRVVVRAD